MPPEKIKLKIIVHPDYGIDHKNYEKVFAQFLDEARKRISQLCKNGEIEDHIFIYLAANRLLISKIFELTNKNGKVRKKFRYVSPGGNYIRLRELKGEMVAKLDGDKNLDLPAQIKIIEDSMRRILNKIAEIEIWGFGRGACGSRLRTQLQKKFPNLKIELGDEKILFRNP